MSDYDALVIGAGHSGLTCTAAGAQRSSRNVARGAAVTEEFHPGFRNSVAAYTVSLLQPKVIRDLKLYDHGSQIVTRRAQNFLPSLDSPYLLTGAPPSITGGLGLAALREKVNAARVDVKRP